MRAKLEFAITPLLVYRLTCVIGVLFIYVDGVIADSHLALPDLVLKLRLTAEVVTGSVLAMTFLSEQTRKHIGFVMLGMMAVVMVYSASVVHATSLGIDEVLGAIMVLCASSAVFHQTRLVVANLILGSTIYLAFAFPIDHPVVAFDKFAVCIVGFAVFFMILMVSNLHARARGERSEEAANAWFDNSADALIYGDVLSETVQRANPAALALFETDDPRAIVEIIVRHALAQEPELTRQALLSNVAGAELLEDVFEFESARGRRFWGAVAVRKLNIGGEPLTLLRITDASARVAHENALEAARDAAEHAAQTRTRFLANMSHEIRTPMNGVIGMASLMQDTELDEQQKGFLQVIRGSGEALLTIINEILDFSKIDAEQVQLEAEPFDLIACAEEALDVVRPAASDKQLELSGSFAPELDGMFIGDRYRVRQVLVNLLSNAVKFTESGAVALRACQASNSGRTAHMGFEIEDTGIGIEADKLDSLFDPFRQADASTTRQYGGTGLGLSISKRLAELMGGDISVRSTPGEGTCFTFTLELEPAAEQARADRATRDSELQPLETAGYRFLLAEDNLVNQQVAVQMLQRLGVQVDVVGNGRAAVEAVQAQHYDFVFMDVQMPELDGLEASSLIRQNPDIPQPYIIALTANALAEDRAACLTGGMDDFIAKPVQLEDLHEALGRALARASAATQNPSSVFRSREAWAPPAAPSRRRQQASHPHGTE